MTDREMAEKFAKALVDLFEEAGLNGIADEMTSTQHAASNKYWEVMTEAKGYLIPESHVTPRNPNGTVQQCDRRDVHPPHEWQAAFGAYFDSYCPGNDGTKK